MLVVGYVQSGKLHISLDLWVRAAGDFRVYLCDCPFRHTKRFENQGQRYLIIDLIGDHHGELDEVESIPVEGEILELLTTLDGDFKKDARDVRQIE